MSAPELQRLQEWLAHVTSHRATADVAVRSKRARALFALRDVHSGKVVKPNDRMSVTDRLQIYNGAYLARLREVLESDFIALPHLLGQAAWMALSTSYVARHPSRHANLNRFGEHMAAFVASRRDLPHRAFARDLARLEWAIAEAFAAEEFTPLDPTRLQSLAPEDWSRARLIGNPSLRILTCRHPVNAWYIAFRESPGDLAALPPKPARSHTAVFRKDHRVWRLDLPPRAHAVLRALLAGEPLEPALERARGDERVGEWFQSWAADGFFTDIRVANTTDEND